MSFIVSDIYFLFIPVPGHNYRSYFNPFDCEQGLRRHLFCVKAQHVYQSLPPFHLRQRQLRLHLELRAYMCVSMSVSVV